MVVEGVEVELMKVQVVEKVKDVDINVVQVIKMVFKVLEYGIRVVDLEIEEGLVREKLKIVEEVVVFREG